MKKTIIPFILMIAIFLMTGCVDSKEQKKLNTQYVNRAKINAENYIEEKYDFTPEILDAVQERQYGMFNSTPLSTVYVRMTYNGRDFGVYIDGSCENTDGSDNYQQPELKKYFAELIAQKLPEPDSLTLNGGKINTAFDPIEAECVNMYSAYFNGTNISELLSEGDCSVTAEYVCTDISELSEKDFPDELFSNTRCNIRLVSFRKPDYLGHYYKSGTNEMLPLYAESLTVINSGGTSSQTYSLGNVGDIFYYIDGEDCDTVTVTEIESDDGSNWNNEHFNVKTASKAYAFKSTHNCKVRFFFPQSAIEQITNRKTFQAYGICRGSGSDRTYETFYANDFSDDYEVGYININADEDVYVVFLHKTSTRKFIRF
ncbi:MAG: hypothetical protein NC320_08455 [Clostridium sp.]|nr:hypothetical protein [Clostridium sp.]